MDAKLKKTTKPDLKIVKAERELARIMVAGHADHGKSALVDRLSQDTGRLPDGIIDSNQAYFKTNRRDYAIIDAPGYSEFVKDMLNGAPQADAALVVLDVLDNAQEQSRQQGYLLHLMGISQVVVAVNKMDAAGYSKERFTAVEAEYRKFLKELGVKDALIIPVSALEGDTVSKRSPNMPWYTGPSLIDALDAITIHPPTASQPLRFAVLDVQKAGDRRIIAGRIESGTLCIGDDVMFSPSNKTARIKSIEAWPSDGNTSELSLASAGQSIGITLDVQAFVESAGVVSHLDDMPLETDVFHARILWFGNKPLKAGQTCKAKLLSAETRLTVERIENVVGIDAAPSPDEADAVEHDQIADVVVRAKRILALDEFDHHAGSGRLVLFDDDNIAGGGVISMRGYADQRDLITQRATNITRVSHGVERDERELRNGHTGGVLWFTGLSGSGKSTLAVALERRLFDLGYNAFVLDGDNVRHGLNANLGFSPEDRAENIRRVGELSALFARSSMLVITAFISPYQSDRERARTATGDHYHEVYIKADLETCERRDPKGLYKKARAGEIADFTGISAPYEEPVSAELEVDTAHKSPDDCVDELIAYVEAHFKKRG